MRTKHRRRPRVRQADSRLESPSRPSGRTSRDSLFDTTSPLRLLLLHQIEQLRVESTALFWPKSFNFWSMQRLRLVRAMSRPGLTGIVTCGS